MRVAAAAVFALAALAGPARADMLDEAISPRAVGAGDALTAASYGSVAKTLNPAGIGLEKAFVVEASYGLRPADDAKMVSASVCDSTMRVGACLSYDYVNASPVTDGERSLHVVSLATSIPLSDRVFAGVTTRYINYSESGALATPVDHSRSNDFAGGVGILVKLTPTFNAAAVGHNLYGHDESQFPRAVSGGVALYASPKLLLVADGRWNIDQDGARYAGGAEYFFTSGDGQAGLPIRVGYVYEDLAGASYATAGLSYITPKVALDVGGLRRVDEGDELMLQFGIRLFNP